MDDVTSCSKNKENVRISRIVGGQVTDIRKYPFIVNLFVSNRSACAGSLITQDWVLTAAHCLSPTNLRSMQLLAGQSNVHSLYRNPCSQLLPIKTAIKHQSFNAKPIINDIGLVQADGMFVITDYVNVIRTAKEAENLGRDLSELGRKCIVIGWGHTHPRNATNKTSPYTPKKELHEVELPLISLEKCQTLVPRYKITPTQLCTLDNLNKRDACIGDSGGPLFWDSSESERDFVLQGIVSYGFGCARPGNPAIFTRVDKYETWINEIVFNSSYNEVTSNYIEIRREKTSQSGKAPECNVLLSLFLILCLYCDFHLPLSYLYY